MEPQGRTIASPLQTRTQSKTFRLGKTTLRVRAHVQAVGLNAETKNRPALSRRGDFSLDISFYRTRRLRRKPAVEGGFSILTTRHAAFRLIVPLRRSLSVRAAGR